MLRPAVALFAFLVALSPAVSGRRPRTPSNPIQRENAEPGSRAWERPLSPGPAIEGYASQVSVRPGSSLDLHVSTNPPARYRVEVFRIGWYRGDGARRIACVPTCAGDEQGAALPVRPPDPDTGFLDAGWPVTDRIEIPRSAVSGYFVAELVLTSGELSGHAADVPFIVRAPKRRQRSAILVQAAVNTWEAYNNWGGKSLYDFNSTNRKRATRVSFERPLGPGLVGPARYEYQLVRFLERHGFDVSYTTDVDTDRSPGRLRRHRLVLSAGHDEYWSKRMRDAFEAARDSGTNLGFVGADAADWQIRYADARRTIVEYRDASADPEPDPALKTTRFSQLVPPRPQCQLVGVTYHGYDASGQHDYAVASGALPDRWFRGTGLTDASIIRGVVGYEWDGVDPGCNGPKPTVLLRYEGPPSAEAVRYRARSGAVVFSSGTLSFSWALDAFRDLGIGRQVPVDTRVQRFMRNVFRTLSTSRPEPGE